MSEPPRTTPPPWLPWTLALAVLVPRLAVFPWTQNVYGDSVVRMELARRWATAPHWILSFHDGAMQFGPLQIALSGAALWLDPDPLRAGRWVSLIFGVATAWPLYALTRRLFDWRAATAAVLGLAVWGLHIQASTTAASEAISLFFVLVAIERISRWREELAWGPLAVAALAMNLAMATRYDPWLLAPILAATVALEGTERARALTQAGVFVGLCAVFPFAWLWGNWVWEGSPLYAIHFTEQYHRVWAAAEIARMGTWPFRLRGLVFWPGTALLTLSPGIALAGAIGAVRAQRVRPELRWLLFVMILPALYFTVKCALFADFVPLARFAIVQVAMLLPFIWSGFEAVGRRAAALSLALAVATPVAITAVTWDRDGVVADTLRPVSPLTRNPPAVQDVADFLRQHAARDAVILNADPGFWDLQIGAFSGVGDEQLIYRRSPDYEERVRRTRAKFLVVRDGTMPDHQGWTEVHRAAPFTVFGRD